MKIGILTHPLGHNYGGILQNYALQVVLKKMGHDPTTIRIGKYTILNWLVSMIKIFILKLIGRELQYPLAPWVKLKKEKPLTDFVDRNVKCSTKKLWFEEKEVLKYNFDALLVGSDQVWRPCYNLHIEDLFLNFARNIEIRKIAYAASFGTDEWEFSVDQTKLCKDLIKQFDAVSVREDSGVKLCNSFLNQKAEVVLDPTLLLSKSEYEKICKNVEKYSSPTLAVYILDMTNEKMNFVESFAKKKNLRVKLMNVVEITHKYDTIETWLSTFRDAEFVITDSFHGTIFSIIFNKDFYSICNLERGASRFESLLSLFGLKSRLLYGLDLNNDCSINWIEINEKLEELRDQSNLFLKNSLS
ncbi:polysaccharide pyruvyl transferase family protein [Marinifilum flexuosum]|uniref:Polysaccharide pyruvyl transferase n=1 Tax=Marinifilum flexuosum TaxID=1117708 RepID=A0A419XAK3_9BACT|nr:polysaccharide pyruvyl transferase family protein [Marinifilum flexuosum]RKE04600.1 polysaccharide pyruvyl transferase [Marinifilum flexuosum]